MKVLDLFSGIGGFSLGLHAAGMETVAFCEKEAFCKADLKKNWPDIPCHDDVTQLNGSEYAGRISVICGGFPCQDISLAGTGRGLAGERSGLWREYHRIIKETRPEWVIIENVSALRSRGLDEVLRSLAEIGYDAEWHCLPACAIGAPHRRDRIWIMAYPQSQRYTCGEPANEASQEREIEGGGEAQGMRLTEPSDTHRVRNDTPVAHANETGRMRQRQAQPEERRSDLIASGRGEEMAHAYYPRLQGRISAILQERASERAAWSSSALADPQSAISEGNGAEQDWSQDRLTDPSWWQLEPNVGRVANGVPARVDRIKALGNAIVPQIAQVIGQAIMEYENDRA